MKNLMILLFIFSTHVLAQSDVKESHGNREDEIKCTKEVMNLGCGNSFKDEEFLSCIRTNSDKLSDICQQFHEDELDRRIGN